MRRIVVAVATIVALGGCGDTGVKSAEPPAATTTTERPNTVQQEAQRAAAAANATSTTRATLPPTTAAPADYPMGSTLTTEPRGHKLTVYSYKSPVVSGNRFTQPKDGYIFASIEVQHCAGSGGDQFGPNRFDWEIALIDNTRLRAGSTVSEPQLASSPLGPNDCIRGWVTFEVPAAATPRHVVYAGVTNGSAKWRVA